MVVACLFNSRKLSRMNSCHPASNTKGHLVPSCVIFPSCVILAQARFEQAVKYFFIVSIIFMFIHFPFFSHLFVFFDSNFTPSFY